MLRVLAVRFIGKLERKQAGAVATAQTLCCFSWLVRRREYSGFCDSKTISLLTLHSLGLCYLTALVSVFVYVCILCVVFFLALFSSSRTETFCLTAASPGWLLLVPIILSNSYLPAAAAAAATTSSF